MRFQREIKGLEVRQRLEALVIPKRQALTRHQELLVLSEGSCRIVLYWLFKSSSERLSSGCLGIELRLYTKVVAAGERRQPISLHSDG